MANQITDVNSAYEYLATSPMFKLSLSSKELFHSNFLEWLSNVDQDDFKGLILNMAGINEYNWPAVWRVKREYNNFDLCIVAYDQFDNNDNEEIDDNEDFRILFVIENKVKSIPYKEQLERYAKKAELFNRKYWKIIGNKELGELKKDELIIYRDGLWKKIKKESNGNKAKLSVIKEFKNIHKKGIGDNRTSFIKCYADEMTPLHPIKYILLSLAQTFPGSECINDGIWMVDDNVKWKVCNYDTYRSNIEKYFEKTTSGVPTDLYSQIIKDYCSFIECLTKLSGEWGKDYDNKNLFLYKTTTTI